MSAKIQPSPPKIAQNRKEPSAPVGQKGTAPKAEARTLSDTLAGPAKDDFQRTSTQSAKQQAYDKKMGGTSQGVIKQTTADNCGPAAALMAAGVKPGSSAAKEMADLKAKFTNGKGTTTQEMSQMLADKGVAVKQAHYKYDQHTVDQTLSKGGKLLAQVDSNQIQPGAKKGAGASHWVLIDGKDSNGNYQVKDPGTGTAYDIDFSKLSTAIDQNWVRNNTGGMMLLEGSGGSLAQRNAANSITAPSRKGGGGSAGGEAKITRESA